MLNLLIESEIEQEKIIGKAAGHSFTIREGLALIIGAVIALVFYIITFDWVQMVIFTLPFALGLAYLCRKNENGLMAEDVLMKKAEEHFFKNTNRKYRTKNGYIDIANSSYRKLRKKDDNNKAVIKARKKDAKTLEKRKKKSRVKPIL